MQKIKRWDQRPTTGLLLGLVVLVFACWSALSQTAGSTAEEPSYCDGLNQTVSGTANDDSERERVNYYLDCRVREAKAMDFTDSVRRKARVFEWHHSVSVLIFFVVVAMVGCGLWFSAIQFQKALKEDATDDPTEIDMSMRGVKIKSGTIGVLILALSFAFFLVYVIKVYPVLPLGHGDLPSASGNK